MLVGAYKRLFNQNQSSMLLLIVSSESKIFMVSDNFGIKLKEEERTKNNSCFTPYYWTFFQATSKNLCKIT